MPNGDPIKDLYNATKGTKLFLDESDFREQLLRNPKEVYSIVSGNKDTRGLFLDYSDFENLLSVKKKVGGNASLYGANPFDYNSNGQSKSQENKWLRPITSQGEHNLGNSGFVDRMKKTDEYADLESKFYNFKKATDDLSTLQSKRIYGSDVAPGYVESYKRAEAELTNKKSIAEQEKNKAIEMNRDKVIKPINNIVSNGRWKDFLDDGVFDEKYAQEVFNNISKQGGGGSYVKDLFVSEMKRAVEAERDRPQFNKFLEEEYKKSGIDLSKYGNQLYEKLAVKKINQIELFKKDADRQAAEYLKQIEPIANEVGGEYKQKVSELQELYKNEGISESDANAALQKINNDYVSKIKSLDDEYITKVKEINQKTSQKYARIQNELEAIGKSITDEQVWQSIPDDEKKKIQMAQESAYARVQESKNNVKKAQDMAVSSISPGAVLFKSVASGWNSGLASLGDYLSYQGFNNRFTRGLQSKSVQAEKLSPAEYSWKKNPFMRAVTSAGKSLGASAPVLIPSIGVTLATSGAGLPAIVTTLAGGTTAFLGEKVQNTGDIYGSAIEKGFDPGEAAAKASEFSKDQNVTIPLYFIGAMGLQNLLKGGIKKTLIGTGLEFTEELPVEYYQGYTEAKQLQGYDKDFGSYIKENPELALDVTAGVLGQGSTIGGATTVVKNIFSKSPNPEIQFQSDMLQKHGLEFAMNNLNQQLDNKLINEQEFQVQAKNIQQLAVKLEKLDKAGLKGDDAKAFVAYSEDVNSLTEELSKETDEGIKITLQEQIAKSKENLVKIARGEGVFAIVTMPGGGNITTVMPVENVTDEVIKSSESIVIKNDEAKTKEFAEKKKTFGNDENVQDGFYQNGLSRPKTTAEKAIEYSEDIKSENWRNAFLKDPEVGLKEVAQQLHGTTNEADGANKTFGKRIADLALELYPTKESTEPSSTVSGVEGGDVVNKTSNNEKEISQKENDKKASEGEYGEGVDKTSVNKASAISNDKKDVNTPFESNEHGRNFYDANKLELEDTEVEIDNPHSVNRDLNRGGGGKMYDETTISSKKKFPSKVFKEGVSNHAYIIDRGENSDIRFGVSDKVGNYTVNAKTYDDALKIAKTILAIRERDPNAVLTVRDYNDKTVYDFSEQSTKVEEQGVVDREAETESKIQQLEQEREGEVVKARIPEMMGVNDAIPSRESVSAGSTTDNLTTNKETRKKLKNRYTGLKNLFECLTKT